ncbi:hypothetical protein [Actinomadura rupiterrae]|uniref:hypothetical protein n=1 Tax=Actinomadura rupiterrae TaxID=559627 RepID=UPI0020A38337|nr:hypothetical protein [Actinomadura rupiterrae]MCP2336132.1 hypothetical protein [Actinomadura rupiterrae]
MKFEDADGFYVLTSDDGRERLRCRPNPFRTGYWEITLPDGRTRHRYYPCDLDEPTAKHAAALFVAYTEFR